MNSEPDNSELRLSLVAGLTPLSVPACHSSLLFVYGTLRRGGERYSLLERLGAAYVGKGSVAGELYDLGAYPGALKSRSKSARVVGEVYHLPNTTPALRSLDEYEGVFDSSAASLYAREITQVTLENGERLDAWIYWLSRAPQRVRRIESGDYARR